MFYLLLATCDPRLLCSSNPLAGWLRWQLSSKKQLRKQSEAEQKVRVNHVTAALITDILREEFATSVPHHPITADACHATRLAVSHSLCVIIVSKQWENPWEWSRCWRYTVDVLSRASHAKNSSHTFFFPFHCSFLVVSTVCLG